MLEKTDELEQLGQLSTGFSKVFSQKILELSKLVPPIELEASMNRLETEIKQKLAEMDQKIKNLKSKKKNKTEKKTIKQRMMALSVSEKDAVAIAMRLRDQNMYPGYCPCCQGLKA